jgi:hypothetical protein
MAEVEFKDTVALGILIVSLAEEEDKKEIIKWAFEQRRPIT